MLQKNFPKKISTCFNLVKKKCFWHISKTFLKMFLFSNLIFLTFPRLIECAIKIIVQKIFNMQCLALRFHVS